MKKIVYLLLTLLLLLTSVQAQPVQKIKAPIHQVSVFRNQAIVKRYFTIDLTEGAQTIVLENLSPFLDPTSIEVKTQDAMILNVGTHDDHLKNDEKPANIQLLEDSLERMNSLLTEVTSDLESVRLQKELLLANKQVGGTQQGLKADELEDVLALYEKKLNDFKNSALRLQKQEKHYNECIQKLAAQLNEYRQGQMNLSKQIWVSLSSDQPKQQAKVEVSYLVNNVSWQPAYEIRTADTHSPLNLTLKARLTQTTGEEWLNVKLKFGTANPTLGANCPVLYPELLRFAEPLQVKYKEAAGQPAMNARMNIQLSAADAYSNPAELTENELQTEFVLKQTATIPSDGMPHTIELMKMELQASYSYKVVPKLDKDVFVVARVAANDIVNQIKGEAAIFFNGAYTGKCMITGASDDTLSISLGRDKRIIVDRVQVKEMSSKSLFGGTRTEQHAYEISVRNAGKFPIALVIEDQVPMSTDKEIVVTSWIDDGGAIDTETGKITWRKTIAAEQSVKVHFHNEVKYPSNKRLQR